MAKFPVGTKVMIKDLHECGVSGDRSLIDLLSFQVCTVKSTPDDSTSRYNLTSDDEVINAKLSQCWFLSEWLEEYIKEISPVDDASVDAFLI